MGGGRTDHYSTCSLPVRFPPRRVNRGYLSALIDLGEEKEEGGKAKGGKRYLRVITTHVAPSANVAGAGSAALIGGIVTAARDAQIAELVAYIREVREEDDKKFGGAVTTVLAGDVVG